MNVHLLLMQLDGDVCQSSSDTMNPSTTTVKLYFSARLVPRQTRSCHFDLLCALTAGETRP